MAGTTKEESQIILERIGNVCVIRFTGNPHKANVFTIPLLERLNHLLDQVEAEHMPCSLLLTGTAKFFSAGFDLQSLTGTPHNNNKKSSGQSKTPQGQALVSYSWEVLARILIFPAPTFCLLNGHAFGLGLFLALACDHRIMGSTGFLCLPEITIGLPLGSGFAALAKCKLDPKALRTSALTGKKWTCQEALNGGVIDAIVETSTDSTNIPQQLLEIPQQVLEMAEELVSTSEQGNLSQIKMELYRDTHAVLVPEGRSRL